MIPVLELPFWLGGRELEKLRQAAFGWWEKLTEWAMIPVNMQDPDNCTEGFLKLLAWQRDIKRFSSEPLEMFRKRVRFARINAIDSGSVAGFKRIFQRLGVGYVEIEERLPGQDWDIVSIRLSDSQLSINQKLLEALIQHYGRTCRRYDWQVITPISVKINTQEFNHDTLTIYAKVPPLAMLVHGGGFDNDTLTIEAKL
ncbi:phage tail protein [Maridesulfovibrio zosterae]|uniref:phage tail protein n=1 Tax=Maridesulfovibrio zosterae TaxID=82171 RepID=UPI000426B93A|nr:phage tail protein [Maridesulfovibrio zosterae]